MHLSLWSVATAIIAKAVLFSGCPAVRTAPGLVLETFACEELLLASTKGEIRAAIRAMKSFFHVLHG
jgi:hypothetical protein